MATVRFERADKTGFAKLTFIVYIAFLMSLVGFVILPDDTRSLTGRMGIASGALFAVALSVGRATSAQSSEEGLTLVDNIHVAALIAILINAAATLVIYFLFKRGHPAPSAERFNGMTLVVVVVGFVAINAWLIGRAALA